MIPRLLAFALLLTSPGLASAQSVDENRDSTIASAYSHPIGFRERARPDASDIHRPAAMSDDKINQGPRAAVYILGGAAIGALAAGAALAIAMSRSSDECICDVVTIAGIAVGGGGVGGALLGLMVYVWRKEIWEPRPF
jgi:hypothetical protein